MPKSLDEIMDERVSAPESETETVQPTTPEKVEAEPEQPKPEPEKPLEGNQPEAAEPEAAEGNQTVPLKALQEERQRLKDLREQNQQMQQQMQQMYQHMMQAQQPQKPQEPAKKVNFWDDPDAYVNDALSPLQQQMQQQKLSMSKAFASEKVSADDLDAMDLELAQAAQSDPAVAAEAQRIMQSAHPYGELVKWHERRKLLNEVGTDPNAYREKLRQELLAELQAQQPAPVTPTQPAAQPVMPSSFAAARNQGQRATPAYGGPQSLSAITRGSAQ